MHDREGEVCSVGIIGLNASREKNMDHWSIIPKICLVKDQSDPLGYLDSDIEQRSMSIGVIIPSFGRS